MSSISVSLFGSLARSTHSRNWGIRSSSAAPPNVDFTSLESAIAKKDSDGVKEALSQLSEIGWAKKWGSQPYVSRRPTSLRELTILGLKNAENLAIPSVRNDAAFLFTVVGTTGFLGVLAGQLPGDWGFFVPYLIGSISLVVLAVGSISPGLLQAAIGGFSTFFPDYQDRIARHEAAHFLIAYLLGLPILGYSLDIGKENVNLIDEKLEKLIYSGQLDAKELDRLAVVAMAGLAAEGLKYDKVVGQSADLFTLQRFINRSKPQVKPQEQQNLTRWAVSHSILDWTGLDKLFRSVFCDEGVLVFLYRQEMGELSAYLVSPFWIGQEISLSPMQIDQTQYNQLCHVIVIYCVTKGVKKLQVLFAGSLLKTNQALHEALMSAMSKKATVLECIEAIEKAAV